MLFVLIISKDSEGKFIMPIDVEIESMRYIFVYDSSTHSLLDSGNALAPFLMLWILLNVITILSSPNIILCYRSSHWLCRQFGKSKPLSHSNSYWGLWEVFCALPFPKNSKNSLHNTGIFIYRQTVGVLLLFVCILLIF